MQQHLLSAQPALFKSTLSHVISPITHTCKMTGQVENHLPIKLNYLTSASQSQ